MKRFLSIVLALILGCCSVSAFALDTGRLTAEALIGRLADSLAGIADQETFSFEFSREEETYGGGLLKDAGGMPVMYGETSVAGSSVKVEAGQEGVVLTTDGLSQGMRWEDVAALLVDLLGQEAIPGLAYEDIGLIAGIAEEIAGGIPANAFSVNELMSVLDGVPAKGHAVSANVYAFAVALDSAVIQALEGHRAQLDDMLARWQGTPGPEAGESVSGPDTDRLIEGWRSLGIAGMFPEGTRVDLTLFLTGGIFDPWSLSAAAADMRLSVCLSQGRLLGELDPGTGEKMTFDSADLKYILSLAAQLREYITPEAFCFENSLSDGMRTFILRMDAQTLRDQTLQGLIRVVGANREGIDALIDAYRPWIEFFAPDAPAITADTLMLGIVSARRNPYYAYARPIISMGRYSAYKIDIQASWPARETPRGIGPYPVSGDAGATAAAMGGTADPEKPILFRFSDGYAEIDLRVEAGHMEALFKPNIYRQWEMTADWDPEAEMLSAKAELIDKMSVYGGPIADYSLDADKNGLHLYSNADDMDIRVDFRENGADISGTVDNSTVSGTVTVMSGLWKLYLNDGYSALNCAVRTSENSLSVEADIDGETVAAGIEWGEGRLGLNIEIPYERWDIGVQRLYDGQILDWSISSREMRFYSEGTIASEPTAISADIIWEGYRSGRGLALKGEACWKRGEESLTLSTGSRFEHGRTICYEPGELFIIDNWSVIHISDITPAGCEDRNVLRVAVYDAVRYGSSVSPEDVMDIYTVTTGIDGERYHITVEGNDAEICALTMDFDPDTALPVSENVLWLTPALFKLMFNLADVPAADAEMPIPVYARETQPGVYEETDVPEALEMYVPVGKDADSEIITRVQQRLYVLGILSAGDIQSGVLDKGTLEAVAFFQDRVNTLKDAGLYVIDPADPGEMISANTLWWLFDADIGPYA